MTASFQDLFDEYVLEKRPSPATVQSYKYVLKVFIRDTEIEHPTHVTRRKILLWRDQVLERASVTTWNTYLRQLRALCNFGVKRGYLNTNPFLEVDFLKALSKLKKTIKKDTYTNVIEIIQKQESASFEPPWFWILVLRMLHRTGMRRRQLVGLRWPDISFEEKSLVLRAESSKNRREWKIPISGLEDELKALKALCVHAKGADYLRDGQVFNISLFNPRVQSSEMTVDQVSRFFRKLKSFLPADQPISPHRLRHTFGTEASKQGDLKAVQDMMGHTDIRITAEYVHPDLDRMRGVIKHWDDEY